MFFDKPQYDAKKPEYGSEEELSSLIANALNEQNSERKIDYWATAFYEWKCLQDKEGLFSNKDDKGKFEWFCGFYHLSDSEISQKVYNLYFKRKKRAKSIRKENLLKNE